MKNVSFWEVVGFIVALPIIAVMAVYFTYLDYRDYMDDLNRSSRL